MKIKLTPELSYLIGLWCKSRAFDGLGVRGEQKILEVFSKEALTLQLTTPDKLLTNDRQVYFYHTAYRRFFAEIEKEQLDRFRYLNEYSANYLAGIFDAVGDISTDGIVTIGRLGSEDELLLLRLGFNTKRRKERVMIERPVLFLTFIKSYVKIFKEHPIMEKIEKLKKKS